MANFILMNIIVFNIVYIIVIIYIDTHTPRYNINTWKLSFSILIFSIYKLICELIWKFILEYFGVY